MVFLSATNADGLSLKEKYRSKNPKKQKKALKAMPSEITRMNTHIYNREHKGVWFHHTVTRLTLTRRAEARGYHKDCGSATPSMGLTI